MEISDIVIGMVVSFDCIKVKENMPPIRELRRNYGEPSELPDEVRPFTCIGRKDGVSQWALLTTVGREERLFIPREERTWVNGNERHKLTGRWKSDPHWINGAVFEGPDEIWVSLATDTCTSSYFRCVTQQMRQQIRAHLEPQLKDPLFPLP